jgi:hypothetical protein
MWQNNWERDISGRNIKRKRAERPLDRGTEERQGEKDRER